MEPSSSLQKMGKFVRSMVYKTDDFKEILEKHGGFLIDRLDPNFGLLDVLQKSTSLRKEVRGVRSVDPAERSGKLISIISSRNKDEFLEALKEADQTHIANFILEDGVFDKAKYGDLWPLTEREIQILEDNQGTLVDLMDTAGGLLLDRLYSAKVVNARQKETINSKPTRYEKVEAFLEILRKRSFRDYNATIQCLHESQQGHIAEILEEGGATFRVSANLTTDPPVPVDPVEEGIVSDMINMLDNLTVEDSHRLLDLVKYRLIGVKKGQSVDLYFHCRLLEELDQLHLNLRNGHLRDIVENLFKLLIATTTEIHVELRWIDDDFIKMRQMLAVQRRQVQEMLEEEMVQDIPEEEMMEEENVNVEAEPEPEPINVPSAEEEEDLDEEVVLGKLHAEALGPETSAQSASRKDVEIMADILRNNTEFLVYNIIPRGLLDRLHATGCLTDGETRYIKTLALDRDKNDEILRVIRNRSILNYNKFFDALHHTDQHFIAEVVERGGVVMKAAVTIDEDRGDQDPIKEQLVNCINQLLVKKGPVKPQLLHFFCLLKRNGLDILSAKREKDIILWIWCKSQAAFRKLNRVNETDVDLENFHKILTLLFRLLLDDAAEIPEIVNIDLEDTDRRFVCRTPCLKRRQNLQTAPHNVCGIAELENKFYVLSQSPSCIYEYEDFDSSFSDNWNLTSVREPAEIVSSNKSCCLYIGDTGSSSIWKATVQGKKVSQWLENISNSFTMSLTKNEDILLVKRGQPATIEVYDPNATRIICLALPSSIGRPIHAVESLTGSFFISFRGETVGQSGICDMTKNGDIVTLFDSSITRVENIEEDINQVLSNFVTNPNPSDHHPEYLALDKRGNLYATDPSNNRLMILDGRLNLGACFEEDLIKAPVNMHFVNLEKQLMVLHGAAQRTISVLDIQYESQKT